MAVPEEGRVRHVVVADDDPETRRIIRDILGEDGFRVTPFAEAESLLAMIPGHHPDLVILDPALPGVQGLDILRRLQDHGRIPSIVVSRKGSEMDRVVGLELGADDYLTKPFSGRELLARVHAVLRRTSHQPKCEILEFETITIDLTTRDVVAHGRLVQLTALEFDLLAFLASSPRQVFSRETLLDRVWGSSAEWQTTATVSEHIHRLRSKIEPDPARPRWIETLRGVGYRFVPWMPQRVPDGGVSSR
jgi:DNA-binding response OmpR family regulator